MSVYKSDLNYYAGRWHVALIILCVFSLLFSHLLFVSHAFFQKSTTLPNWQGQTWLEYPNSSEVLYTRKNFNVNVQAEWASLTVSAVDDFSVYLNNEFVGSAKLSGGVPVQIYDVTALLQKGKNTVAIRTSSEQRGVSARIIAKLEWRAFNKHHILLSDSSWQVDNKKSFQREGLLAWFNTGYEQVNWAFASSVRSEAYDLMGVLHISESTLQNLQAKSWIWLNHLSVSHIKLSRTFDLKVDNISNAWVGVSVQGSYQITVNQLAFTQIPGKLEKMSYLNIAPYLREGENTLTVQLQSGEDQLNKVAISGLVIADHQPIYFSADQSWFCGNRPCRFVSAIPKGELVPQLKVSQRSESPKNYSFQNKKVQLAWFIGTLFLSLLPTIRIIPLLMNTAKMRFSQACLVYSQPYSFATLLLALVFIINSDSRFDITAYYSVALPLLILTIIILFLFLIVVEYIGMDKGNTVL